MKNKNCFYNFLVLTFICYGCAPAQQIPNSPPSEVEVDESELSSNEGEVSGTSENNNIETSSTQENSIDITPIQSDRSSDELNRALYEAARTFSSSSINEMRNLLDQGANPNVVHRSSSTALLASVINGDINKVRLLLDKGANPNLGSPRPLSFAYVSGDSEIISLLESAGAQEL